MLLEIKRDEEVHRRSRKYAHYSGANIGQRSNDAVRYCRVRIRARRFSLKARPIGAHVCKAKYQRQVDLSIKPYRKI